MAPVRFPVRWFTITVLVALLMFAYTYLDDVARGTNQRALAVFVEEVTGVFGAALLFPLARRVARRLYPDPVTRAQLLHLPAVLLFSVTHTSLNWASRSALFPVAGLGGYDYGRIPVRYLMELPIDVIIYALFVAGVWMFDGWARDRARALRAAQVESQLTEARLQNLQLQLQPHFLFNALNTISSAMYEDPRAADAMLTHLSDLLRVSLRSGQTQEVSLAEELEALHHYTSLLTARFGSRLRLRIDVAPRAREARVPSFVLQPLVENAVRHGNLSKTGAGRIDVRAAAANGRLVLEVEDDGPGLDPAAQTPRSDPGVGLAATRSRLRLLYGEEHALELGRGSLGGLHVKVEIPFVTKTAHARVDR